MYTCTVQFLQNHHALKSATQMQIARNIWAVGSVFVTQDSKATGLRVNVSFY